ncbi:microsomal glutathione S-transferase 3 [Auricularia subglabra TFB-10046 SS5]|nr:microsomal glutathione S-transferase 3 [Auricularia subglabra TFB-10046 SS5]
MPFTLQLPDSYPLVILTAVGSYWLNFWQGALVGRARGRAKVPYPLAYADAKTATENPLAQKFNCTQRAHMNTLESMPAVILGVLVTGLHYPRAAIFMGAAQLIGRIIYTINYASGDPKKRNRGSLHYVGTLGLLFASTWTAIQFIKQSPGILSGLI